MRAFDVSQLLAKVPLVRARGNQIVDDVLAVADAPRSVSTHVKFERISGECPSFAMHVMNFRIDARMEYIKFHVRGREVLGGQFRFFVHEKETERKLSFWVRFGEAVEVFLPDESVLEFYAQEENTDTSRQLKDAIAVGLSAEMLNSLDQHSI